MFRLHISGANLFGAASRWSSVIIAVGGCVASQEGAAIVSRAPYVDVVFGPQTLHRLPEILEGPGLGELVDALIAEDQAKRLAALGE